MKFKMQVSFDPAILFGAICQINTGILVKADSTDVKGCLRQEHKNIPEEHLIAHWPGAGPLHGTAAPAQASLGSDVGVGWTDLQDKAVGGLGDDV